MRDRGLDRKLAISAKDSNKVRGEESQRKRVWEKFTNINGERFCVFCRTRIDRRKRANRIGCEEGQWHHLIKRRYFPSLFEVNKGIYSDQERKTKHHISNSVIVCQSCHATWEGFENGRPHIMSWLCKNITGQEIALKLPPHSQITDRQREDWIRVQNEVEKAYNYQCRVCGRQQRENVTKDIHTDSEVCFRYTGRDIRAVHILPPVLVPELTHHPEGLILLCWNCLFGADKRNSDDDPANWTGWWAEPADNWAKEFKPYLFREYRDRL